MSCAWLATFWLRRAIACMLSRPGCTVVWAAWAWVAAVRIRLKALAVTSRISSTRWRMLWVLPVAGIGLSVVFAVIPGFVSVVHGAGTWELVRKPELSWRWNYVAQADLAAAAPTDPLAAGILARTTRWPAATNAAPAVPAPTAP